IDFDAPGRKTVVRLERLRLLDGAATLTADVRAEDVITAGEPGLRPVVEQLALKVDLPAIARALPAELGPAEVEGEPLVVTVKNAALAPSPQGALTASGVLARARWRDIALRELTLGVDGKPVGNGGAQGELRVAVGELTMPGLAVRRIDATLSGEHPADEGAASGASPAMWPIAVTARATLGAVETPAQKLGDVAVAARATVKSASALDGELTLDVGRLDAGAAVEGVHVEAAAKDVVLAAQPLASTGSLRARGTVAAVRSPGGPRARRVAFTADAALAGAAPARTRIALDAAELVVPGLAAQLGPSFAGGPVHAEIEVPSLELDVADPARSRGSAALTARYGGATVEGTARGSLDEVTYTMKARAPRLGPAREVVVGSRGTVRPADRRISHDTDLQIGPTALASAALRGAKIHVVSSGTPVQHQGKIALAVDAPSSGGRTFPSARLDITASADLARGAVDVRLQGAEPPADLHLTALLDAARTVHWQVKGRLSGLAAASAMLPPGTDWSRLAVEIDGRGVASGIVARVVGGMPQLVADPARALRGHQALTVTVRDVHYADAALNRADVDAATLKAEVDLSATRTAVVALDVPALAAVSRGVKLGARALAVRLDATLGAHGVARGVDERSESGGRGPAGSAGGEGVHPPWIDAKLSVKAASATQSAAPWYGIEDPALEVTVAGDPDATLAIAMHVANPGGATAFDLQGNLERGHTTPTAGVVARNSLALEGTLVQGLDRLAAAPGTLAARGQIRVPLRIESGDLTLFRTSARIGLDHVAVDLPAAKVRLTDINGELPVVQEIVLGPDGVQRVGQGEHGPFSQLRFPDYRPFAGDADYLSIGGIDVNGMAFGPVAGNARVDHDIAALDQLELNALDGKITGQLLAELRGLDTRLVFRGKLTGLRAPAPGKTGADGREPLDANLAIALTPYRYGLEGRAELVRIGRDHLRALLDVWDPYRADVAVNRVRLALLAGYPKQVRLQFASGFAALAIELGGLAGLVRIDELRGLPIGPALARYLAPVLEP
ncbi:MAG TPA: hypothetical protein VLM79_35655, partial [Kofleriaceae bacterium]|nr:hypothetical protein [Kofleriaceae bacterium]